ncbi:MAG TPA: hypothetical protein VIY48_09000 [Candidatus Paceibacterota bacterium]
MNKNQIIGGVVALAVVGGGAFYGGTVYAKGQTSAQGQFATGNGQFFARTGGPGNRTGGGFTAGKIISVSNGQLVIQSMQSSSTEIVLLGNSTQIEKTVRGTQSDLTAGTNVVVTGSSNSDGSLTAQSVQIRPVGAQLFGGRSQVQ